MKVRVIRTDEDVIIAKRVFRISAQLKPCNPRRTMRSHSPRSSCKR